METNLRPRTLGEILDRTAQLYRENFLVFAGIAAVYAGALLILSLLQIGAQEYYRVRHMMNAMAVATVIGALIMWPVIVVVGGLAVAANNRAVGWVHLGEPATVRGAYSSILPRIGRYLWLMIITTFIIWAPLALIAACYFAAAFSFGYKGKMFQNADPQGTVVLLVLGFVFGLLLLAWVAYAVVMGLRYSLAVPACVVEDITARQAIRRSIALSKGSRGRIFLLALLVIAVEMGLVLITQMFFIFAVVKNHGQLSAGMRALQQIVTFCTNTFVGPIYATGLTLFYYDQRVRKEGYDIEWMMQSAGLNAPAAPAGDVISETPVQSEDAQA
jgi:uncharacterized membrane protein